MNEQETPNVQGEQLFIGLEPALASELHTFLSQNHTYEAIQGFCKALETARLIKVGPEDLINEKSESPAFKGKIVPIERSGESK